LGKYLGRSDKDRAGAKEQEMSARRHGADLSRR
jgi:hypothetical protein